jgi:hypothetical protein
MKDILRFKSMQEMSNEADEYLATIKDEDVKVCAKFLLISGYAYMNDYMIEDAKKTYQNLSILIKYELVVTEYSNGMSKYQEMLSKPQVKDSSVAKRMYNLYYNCDETLKKKAQMHLMNKMLTSYFK